MAVQNPYNNYIKRQTQKPYNNFKQKVMNSLSGTSTNNNTKAVTSNIATPTSPQVTQAPKPNNTPTQPIAPKPVATQPTTPVTPQATPQVVPPTSPVSQQATPQMPTQPTTTEGAQGLMPREEVMNSITGGETNPNSDVSSQEQAQVNPMMVRELAQDPSVQRQAMERGKSPEDIANDILQSQIDQANKDKEAMDKLTQEQKDLANQQYEQSKIDAEKAYQDGLNTIYDNQYNQMEDLNVSGTNRGIQYSPQQLGLENVVNINTNKNVAKANEERLNLLNKLDFQYKTLLNQINQGSMSALSDYNKTVLGYQNAFNQQMMDWKYDKNKTEDERKWQEEQAQKDREWQKEWLKYQMEMEKKNGRSSSGYSSGGGRSYSSYSPYSRSFTPYEGSYGGGSGGGFNDYSDDIEALSYTKMLKNGSTDLYNALDSGGTEYVQDRADIYKDIMDSEINSAKNNGLGSEYIDELNTTRETALKHLYNKSYARDTNTPIQLGNTVYQSTTPLRQDYIDKKKSTKYQDKADYDLENSNNSVTRRTAIMNKKATALHENTMKPKSKPKTTTKAPAKTKKQKKKEERNTRNAKAVKKSNSNVKKSLSNSKKNSKKSVSKSMSNFKKNVSNMFKKKDKKKK